VRYYRSLRAGLKPVLLGAGAVLGSIASGPAADYHIDRIEVFNRTYINIHFDTVANRTYALQYRSSVNFTNAPGTSTNRLVESFVAPAQVFPNHYVISDFRTNQQRYYRLRVTP